MGRLQLRPRDRPPATSGKGSGIAFADGRVWASLFDRRLVVELDPVTEALIGAVHTGAGPRESIVAGGML